MERTQEPYETDNVPFKICLECKEFYTCTFYECALKPKTFICSCCNKEYPISARCSKGYCISCSGGDF